MRGRGSKRVRLPNPARRGKGRLDARGSRVHRSKKAYRRRPKHPGRGMRDE